MIHKINNIRQLRKVAKSVRGPETTLTLIGEKYKKNGEVKTMWFKEMDTQSLECFNELMNNAIRKLGTGNE